MELAKSTPTTVPSRPKGLHHGIGNVRAWLMAATMLAISALPGCKTNSLGDAIGTQVAAAKENGGAVKHEGLRFSSDSTFASHAEADMKPVHFEDGGVDVSAETVCPTDFPIAVQVAVTTIQRECARGAKMSLERIRRAVQTPQIQEEYGIDVRLNGTTQCDEIRIACNPTPRAAVANVFKKSVGGNDSEM